MAISRFDTPADYKPINTYVPLPYQELALGLQSKQKRYDDNEETQYKLENLIKTVKADPNRQFMLKELDDEYFSKIDDLASTIHDKGDIRYKSELRKIAGKFQTDERVKNLNTSYANYGKYQEDAMKNKEKMTDFYDSYKQDAQSIEQMKKAGIATPTFNYNGMLYKQDYVKDMDNLVGGIAKDGLAKEGYLTYPKGHPQAGELMINDYGQYTKNGNSWEGVSAKKVKEIAKLSVDPFLGKDSSRYFVDQLYGKQVNYNELTPEQQTNVRNVATQTMEHIAAKQIGGTSKQTTDLSNLSQYGTDKLKEDSPIYSPSENGAVFDNPNTIPPVVESGKPGSLPREFNAALDKHMVESGFENGYGERKINGVVQTPEEYSKKWKTTVKNFEQQYKDNIHKETDDQYETVKKLKPGYYKDKKEYNQSLNEAVKKLKKVSLTGEIISKEQSELYDDILNRTKADKLYNVAGVGEMTFNQILDEYKVSPEKVKILSNRLYQDSVNPNQQGASIGVNISIDKGEGGSKVLSASTPINDNYTKRTAIVSKIGQNSIYKGVDTYTEKKPLPYEDESGNKFKIFTETITEKKEDIGKFHGGLPTHTMVTIIDLDDDGNEEDKHRMSYQEFKQKINNKAKEELKNSTNSGQTLSTKDAKDFRSTFK